MRVTTEEVLVTSDRSRKVLATNGGKEIDQTDANPIREALSWQDVESRRS